MRKHLKLSHKLYVSYALPALLLTLGDVPQRLALDEVETHFATEVYGYWPKALIARRIIDAVHENTEAVPTRAALIGFVIVRGILHQLTGDQAYTDAAITGIAAWDRTDPVRTRPAVKGALAAPAHPPPARELP